MRAQITPATLDPQLAVRTLRRYFAFRPLVADDPEIDRLIAEDGGHGWFVYCLHAAARTVAK